MPNTKKDWNKNLKRLGCLVALICFAAVVAGFLAPLQSKGARAERLWQEGRAAYEAKDYETAVTYYRKSAEKGNEKAQFNLARCYAKGEGIEKNQVEAVKWMRKAAEQGFAPAQYNLGCCYETGNGVEKDLKEAESWFRKAVEQGVEQAKTALKRIGAE